MRANFFSAKKLFLCTMILASTVFCVMSAETVDSRGHTIPTIDNQQIETDAVSITIQRLKAKGVNRDLNRYYLKEVMRDNGTPSMALILDRKTMKEQFYLTNSFLGPFVVDRVASEGVILNDSETTKFYYLKINTEEMTEVQGYARASSELDNAETDFSDSTANPDPSTKDSHSRISQVQPKNQSEPESTPSQVNAEPRSGTESVASGLMELPGTASGSSKTGAGSFLTRLRRAARLKASGEDKTGNASADRTGSASDSSSANAPDDPQPPASVATEELDIEIDLTSDTDSHEDKNPRKVKDSKEDSKSGATVDALLDFNP
ncbi:MAG: hypothetical protein CVV64_04130 [Candidatus Wallbacteria bacterium HGW-Wallbacteria-1]|jgi:hypothetical protein|uniref:Uncharacterized protein n=1 Tax=Candidatus Wallbacteria bacterium HGW-Wallbacteria-1 TaxID=2013854 RepID=A0A2N1PRL1_9BACT|nr:MAG: hypothetical protein CVV64_04130 [Candidatus Wallbacteria bacterium HGW-Wallbacteria-1]